jgi:hypothetical protein
LPIDGLGVRGRCNRRRGADRNKKSGSMHVLVLHSLAIRRVTMFAPCPLRMLQHPAGAAGQRLSHRDEFRAPTLIGAKIPRKDL